LSLAKIIPGSWTGKLASASLRYDDGVNAPSSNLNKGLYMIDRTISIYQRPIRHTLRIGAPTSVGLQNPSLSPRQAKSLDSKMDDGSPSEGRLIFINGSSCVNDGYLASSTTFVSPLNTSIGCKAFYYIE
jgi:hypothetical protein